jgi:hypothetical protein
MLKEAFIARRSAFAVLLNALPKRVQPGGAA